MTPDNKTPDNKQDRENAERDAACDKICFASAKYSGYPAHFETAIAAWDAARAAQAETCEGEINIDRHTDLDSLRGKKFSKVIVSEDYVPAREEEPGELAFDRKALNDEVRMLGVNGDTEAAIIDMIITQLTKDRERLARAESRIKGLNLKLNMSGADISKLALDSNTLFFHWQKLKEENEKLKQELAEKDALLAECLPLLAHSMPCVIYDYENDDGVCICGSDELKAKLSGAGGSDHEK